MNFASRPFRRFAFSRVRALASFLLPLLATGSLSAAVIDARWTGGGGTSSYDTPANWDIGQVPLNTTADQFNVFIPGGANVSFDPFSSGGTVQGFSLGLDATFSISPGRNFSITGMTLIDGWIQAVDGDFASPIGATSFSGASTRLSTLNGTVTAPATTYNVTRFSHEAFIDSAGAAGLIDLSEVSTFTYGPTNGRWFKSITATGGGKIDFSGLTSLSVRPGEDDVLDIVVDGGGEIDFTSLQSINGLGGNGSEVVRFNYESSRAYALPALESARTTHVLLPTGSTLSAAELTTFQNGYIEQAGGSRFDAPKLRDVQGSHILVRAGAAFDSAPLTQVDNALFTVESNATFDKVVANSYSTTRFAHDTFFSAVGSGAMLDLSSLTSLTFGPNNGRYFKSMTATGGGKIDLSSMTSLSVRPGEDDVLTVTVGGGGSIDFSSLRSTNSLGGNGNELVQFIYEPNRSFELPSLESGRTTQFYLRANTVLDAPQLSTFQYGYVEMGPEAILNAPALNDVQNSSILVSDGASFNSAPLIEVDNATFAVESNATFDRVAAGSYSNTRFAHDTMFRASGANALLDLSSLATITHGPNNGRYFKSMSATGGGKIDLSNVTSLSVKPGEDDVLSITFDGGGEIDLSSLRTINSLGGNGSELAQFFYEGNRSFSLPSLETARTTQLYLREHTSLSAPALTAFQNGYIELANGATLTAPNLFDVQGTQLLFREGGVFDGQPLQRIDNAVLLVEAGAAFEAVSAETYTNTRFAHDTFFSATGGGARLNLSTLRNLTYGPTNGQYTKAILARGGGEIDLSSVTSISVTPGQDDYLDIIQDSGGRVDLSALQSVNSLVGNTGERVRFFFEARQAYELPELRTTRTTELYLRDGTSLYAPKLTQLFESRLDLGPGAEIQSPLLTNLDNSTITVAANATFDDASPVAYTNTRFAHDTFFAASGANARLTLPSLQTLTYGPTNGQYTKTILASAGGLIDLSGLKVLSVTPGQDDYLDLRYESGGSIDLASLSSINALVGNTGERVRFHFEQGKEYALPQLTSARMTEFYLPNGTSLNLPQLRTFYHGRIEVAANATLASPELENFDNSWISVSGNATFSTGAPSYTNTRFEHDTFFSAVGENARLDLSSVKTLIYGPTNGQYFKTIQAKAGGAIDLSGLTTLTITPGQDDYLDFRIEAGGLIDMSSLRSININQGNGNERVRFFLDEGGQLLLGDIAVASRTEFHLRHITSEMRVQGSLFLDSSSSFSMVEGARLSIAGDLLYRATSEAQAVFDHGLVHLNGSSMQFIEAGGSDLGVGAPLSGNFGIGRLEVGQEDVPTTVQVLDLFDNGNRDGNRYEAMYLYGLGGLDGLLIQEGSTFVLNDVNVYAWLDGEMKHLNELFGDEILAVPFGAGTLALTDSMAGDTNGDWRVNVLDLNAVRNNFGQSGAGITGDANRDGFVNVSDLNDVRNNFGRVAMGNANAVPEPSTLVLLVIAALAGCACRARHPMSRRAVSG